MGVDWIRMQPLAGASSADLAVFVQEQAAAFTATGSWYEGEFDHLVVDDAQGSRELAGHVHIDRGPDSYRRVSTFVLNPVFPAEWRFAAYRSYLPGELPGRVQSWRDHLDEVRRGGHRDYLYAWYRYATTRRLMQEWLILRDHATAARQRTNVWAGRPMLVDLREQILAMPLPTTSPAPYWGTELPGAPVFHSHIADRLTALARAWNSHVPTGQKVRMTRPPVFAEVIVSALGDPGLLDCLGWMQQAGQEGYGLFLDW